LIAAVKPGVEKGSTHVRAPIPFVSIAGRPLLEPDFEPEHPSGIAAPETGGRPQGAVFKINRTQAQKLASTSW
jgi:hypothetical protein